MLRKNGLVMSCEPCRKSKLACDHQMPTCGRCQRRRMEERCFYHPAPMTRKRTADEPCLESEMQSSDGSRVKSVSKLFALFVDECRFTLLRDASQR